MSHAPGRIIEQLQRNRDKGALTFDLATLAAGRKFPVSVRFPDVATGDRVGLFIDNQSADTDYLVTSLGVKATRLCDITWSRGATETTAGTEESVINANTQSDRDFSGVVRSTTPTTGDYTHADPEYFQDIIPGASQGVSAGGTAGEVAFTVPSGSNALLTATNVSGNTALRVSLPFVIYEVDPVWVMSKISADSYTDRARFE